MGPLAGPLAPAAGTKRSPMIDTVRQRTVQYTHNKYACIGSLRESRYTIHNRMERGNKKASARVLLTLKRSFYIYHICDSGFLCVYMYIVLLPLLLLLLYELYAFSSIHEHWVDDNGKKGKHERRRRYIISRWTDSGGGGGGLMTRQRSVLAYCTITHTHIRIYIFIQPLSDSVRKVSGEEPDAKRMTTCKYVYI